MQMTRIKQFAMPALVVLAVLITAGYFLLRDNSEPLTYRFVEVSRGSVESVVSATGKLSAVRTVQVGTQVSGQISAIMVDFNDMVKRGQVIARLDPIVLQQQVRQAEVDMDRVRAEVAQRKYELDQAQPLFDAKVITENEYNTAKYNYTVAQTSLRSAQVSYDRAKQNLDYSTIYAPIDGIVVERNVEPGQTVAASMSTPQLFLLAEDLQNMQILVNVDESDIGSIREGMRTRFNVQAFPNRTFEGTVEQVRLQSAATENVVNYTVVVSVNNDDGVLLPGMTATVTFELEREDDVLKVPAAALRFRPTQEMLAAVGMDSASMRRAADSMRAAGAAGRTGTDGERVAAAPSAVGSADGAPPQGRAGGMRGAAGMPDPGGARVMGGDRAMGGARTMGGARAAGATLFYLDEAGALKAVRVRTGLSNGQETAVYGNGLTEGMRVIAGMSGGPAQEAVANPFGGQPQGGGPGGPGGFGRGGF